MTDVTINTEINSVDQLGLLLAQIADLTKQADRIKDEMKDIGTAGGQTVFEGTFFKSTLVSTNRDVVNYKSLLAEYGIGEDAVKRHTKPTAVFSIRTTSR